MAPQPPRPAADARFPPSGAFPANRYTHNLTSSTSVSLHLEDQQMGAWPVQAPPATAAHPHAHTCSPAVVLGTMYAGEMKKGVFTIMHYLMPRRGVLSLHSSANMVRATHGLRCGWG